MSPSRSKNLFGALAFLLRRPVTTTATVLLLLVVIAIDMAMPFLIGRAINALQEYPRPADDLLRLPLSFAGLFLACVVAREGLRLVLGRIRNRLVQFTLLDIRKAMFQAIQRASFAFHDRVNTGELISRSTTDIARLQTFFYACLYMSLEIAVSIAATIFLIFTLNMALGFVGLLTMVPTVILVAVFAQELHPRWRRVFDL
ncbi:MAG: ABC transporter transmembrane domain-containing protein, partial [Verrucomicrobiia bacterium]